MITVYVSKFHGLKPDIGEVLSASKDARLIVGREKKQDEERFSIPTARQIGNPSGLASLVIRHLYPRRVSSFTLDRDWIRLEETTEEAVGLARVLFGFETYVLFLFRGDSYAKGYPSHRLMFAKCLGLQGDNQEQELVKPIEYELPCLQRTFPDGIWDQDFNRLNPIQKGRIRGIDMRTDILYNEFSDIQSFIGITVQVVGSSEKIKVLTGGRIQFMRWQPDALEDESNAMIIFQKIFEILKAIESCLI